MAGEDILSNERNPKMPPGNGGYTVYGASQNSGSENSRINNFAKKITRFAKNNKGKMFGLAGFGGISIILMFLGSALSGPMQIVHAGQVVGEVIDTARDITNGKRLARNITRVGKDYTKGVQNSRTSMFTRIPARNFEKKMASAGYEIVGDGPFDSIGKNIKYTGVGDGGPLQKLLLEGDNVKPSEFRKVLSNTIDDMPGNKAYKYIMKKTLNKMYGVAWYQGITRMSAGAAKTIADVATTPANKFAAWLDSMATNTKGLKKGALSAASSVAGDAAASIVARTGTKVAGKGLKAIPVIGTVIGGLIDFALGQFFDELDIQGYLASAVVVSGVIATAADNIRNGNIPDTDDSNNYVSQQTYLDYFSQQYIYDDFSVYNGEDDVAAAESSSCAGLAKDSDDYKKCIDDSLNSSDETLKSVSTTTSGSSFFSNTPLKAEFDSNFSVSKKDSEYYHGVPTQLAEVGKDNTWDNIVNAVVGSFTIVGPKDIQDILEGEFNAEEQIPSNIGGTAMYGARVQQNDLSLSEGAYPLTHNEEASLLRETQTYLAEQQMNKSLFARLFDVEDYHSGIATLSRDANWDLSDSSITTQFANVARTFAAVPNLVAKSFGTYTRAAADANPTPYDYGFNMIAYTSTQVDEEPDYWDAEEFLLKDKNFNEIKSDSLKSCTGATITRDSQGIKVAWGESEAWKIKASNSPECSTYFKNADAYTFSSYNASGEQKTFNGEQAVRAVLANYKLLSSYAATSADELLDQELEEIGLTRSDVEKTLSQSMEDMGVAYSTVKKTNGGGGLQAVVEAASSTDELDCQDCVAMVKSVYHKANLPQPLHGSSLSYGTSYAKCDEPAGLGDSGNSLAGYNVCNGYEIHNIDSGYSPVPGDVIVWAAPPGKEWGHVAIYVNESTLSEGGGGAGASCNLLADKNNGGYWYHNETPAGYLHYVGGD